MRLHPPARRLPAAPGVVEGNDLVVPAAAGEDGEHARIEISLDERSFAFWSTRLGRWVVEAGTFTIDVGTSSRDLVSSTPVELEAPSIASPITADSTLQEWFADPVGRAVLTTDTPVGALADSDLLKIIGTMPMSSLALFGGAFGFDRAALDRLVAAVDAAR